MGWLIFVAIALAVGGLLWRFGRLGAGGPEVTGAALFLALAGYASQGSPGTPGNPVEAVEDSGNPEEIPATIRKGVSSSMNAEGQWLQLADALMRVGRTRAAVSILREGTHKAPANPDIWVGLGNALMVHNGGQISPAAQFAFERAARIAPDHPGPPFFLGLGLVQAGKMDEAGEVWRALLARAPDDAPWKTDLEARLAQIGQSPLQPAN
jgi:cytochrome c-type biogenesis protein CcmH/NrfG